MAGLTPNGLVVRTQPELVDLLMEKLRELLPGFDFTDTPEEQIVSALAEELAIAWEALRASHAAQYPSGAEGILLDQLAALTGTRRRPATRSRVIGTANLNAGATLPAGVIVAVEGNPDAQFRTVVAVTNGGASPDDIDVELEAVETGPVAAPAGTLTVIVTPAAGWNAMTNALDAARGRDVARDDELRATRLLELAGAGSGTVDALRAALSRVTGVVQVDVRENVTSTTDGDGRPPKSVEAIVWDEDPPAADDDAIAQAIWSKKAAGIQAYGDGESGTAIDATGAEHTVAFTRATALRTYVVATVVLAPNVGAGWLTQAREAVVARGTRYAVGETSYASQLVCALLAVPGIVAVPTITIGTSPSPSGTSVVPAYAEIVRVSSSSDVTVTEA